MGNEMNEMGTFFGFEVRKNGGDRDLKNLKKSYCRNFEQE
jgi:hypothetical protein